MLTFFQTKKKHTGIFVAFGKYVWLENSHAYSTFGKGALSRSDPTWLKRTRALAAQTTTHGNETQFLEQLTVERRRQRRGIQQDESDVKRANQVLEATGECDFEEYRLDLYEAFYLLYALDAIQIDDPCCQLRQLSVDDCWMRFSQCVPEFATYYAVYHYYRTLAWAPKQGTKFGVDYVLYRSGPRHTHGDFAVKIMHPNKSYDWQTLHQLARVCSQVNKTLILCYVKTPTSTTHPSCLSDFEIRELIMKRWSPEKNREKWVR
ncbi:hypothetical protein LRAMOSA05296 [Lichtheimia ramosa]|uniref:tRNA-splicing endonuclease subunit Sen2 n=1 Tax=Lichtheimia ramosa TaxID=688394 RepID=A0A077X1M3_9FUNG|nr:hypothetical protein LRAMOSA05296 [Lichtheimia ramosa]